MRLTFKNSYINLMVNSVKEYKEKKRMLEENKLLKDLEECSRDMSTEEKAEFYRRIAAGSVGSNNAASNTARTYNDPRVAKIIEECQGKPFDEQQEIWVKHMPEKFGKNAGDENLK